MGLRLVAPVKRKGTNNHQFVQRIPSDLRSRLAGMTLEVPLGAGVCPVTISDKMDSLRFSLRTFDPGEAKLRQAAAIAYLEGLYAKLRANAPVSLTHQQCVALAGEVYRAWAAPLKPSRTITIQAEADGTLVREDEAHDVETLKADQDALSEGLRQQAARLMQLDGEELSRQVGSLVDRVLMRHGLPEVTPRSRGLLLMEFSKALAEGMAAGANKASGDYRPDPNAERFPAWQAPVPPAPLPTPAPKAKPAVSLRPLFESWWREAEAAGRSVSTRASYETAVERLIAFLGHEDAARMSPDDIVRFKEHLLAAPQGRDGKPLSVKTIKDSYLAGLKSVFGWAVDNRKLTSNPAAGISVKAPRKLRTRSPEFTEAERRAILDQASSAVREPSEPWQRFALRRWVPWLCAYSGARLGEMVQLRKQDVRQESGAWLLTITPEAVTVKGGQMREVPLHEHLIEMGFPAFVEAAPSGPLFMWSGSDRKAWRTAKNRLTEEVRGVVDDPAVQPSHGWRHTFRTVGPEAGIEARMIDAICGHAPRTEGETYGSVTLKAKVDAMGRFPRFAAKSIPRG